MWEFGEMWLHTISGVSFTVIKECVKGIVTMNTVHNHG